MVLIIPWGHTLDHLLEAGPFPGGTHRYLARMARGLVQMRLPRRYAFEFLRDLSDDPQYVHHRTVTDQEINDALDFAYRVNAGGGDRAKVRTAQGQASKGKSSKPEKQIDAWPAVDQETIECLAGHDAPFDLEGRGVDGDTGIRGMDAIQELFKPDDLVCLGLSVDTPTIMRGGEAAERAGEAQFICANPMKGAWGINKKGKASPRCQDNVREIRHLVVEFDGHPKPLQRSLLGYLATLRKLRLVVDSGGKSLHGWFSATSNQEADFKFYSIAVALGADVSKWDFSGWVRCPGGCRPHPDGDRLQRILYLSEES